MAFCERCQSENPFEGRQSPDGEIWGPCRGGIVDSDRGHAACCPMFRDYTLAVRAGAESARASEEWPVPERFARARLSELPPKPGYEALYREAKRWAQVDKDDPPESLHRKGALLLYGEPGSGKTHLACAVLNYARNNGWRTAFTTTTRFLNRIASTYRFDCEDSADSMLRRLERAELLVIDDWGKHRINEHSDSQLFHLINSRYELGLPVVVTLNVNKSDVAGSGTLSAIRSRLTEGATVVQFPGVDLRAGSHTVVCGRQETQQTELIG